MKELHDIIKAFDEATATGKQCVLATVVHVEGSSYRQPGARMLITEDGKLTGAISGGCLEGDALRKALLALQYSKPMLVTYDTMDEDDAKLGIGLGCNGIIKILIEPINKNDKNNCIAIFKTILSNRQNAVIATVFADERNYADHPGTCFLQMEDGNIISNSKNDVSKNELINDAYNALLNKKASFKKYQFQQKNYHAFFEFIQPEISLIIFGAGNDVIPLVNFCSVLGWQTTVIDGRHNYVTKERFPNATKLLISRPAAALQHLPVDHQTVFLLMTHNYNYDIAMLQQLVHTDSVYIGMLGPRKKAERMFAELNEKGIFLNEEQHAKIFAPVGLDIGAETSEEIALSIITEIKKVFAGKNAYSLREKLETIHSK